MIFRYPYFRPYYSNMNYRFNSYNHNYNNTSTLDTSSGNQSLSSSLDISDLNKQNNASDSRGNLQFNSMQNSNFGNSNNMHCVSKNNKNNFLNLLNANKKQNPDEDSEILNIFGISLYTDDILIIGLLIFLYIEEIDDPYLFVCLILLLLS